MNKAIILVDRFDLACRNMEMLGSRRKEEQPEIIDEYNKHKKALLDYIQQLNNLLDFN